MEIGTQTSSGDLIDSREVATLLGVTPNNLRQIVNRKELTVIGKENRRSMFARVDVEQLQQHREQRKAKRAPKATDAA